MADFLTSHKIVMQIEGGYANDPQDNGGETYKGVSRKNFPSWPGWKLIDGHKPVKENFDAILQGDYQLQNLVLAFYKANFWDVLSLDKVTDQKIATEMYDTGVNMGTGVSGGFLQISLNALNRNGQDYADLTEDHKIGEKTIAILNAHQHPGDIVKLLNVQQGAKYLAIARDNHSQEKFMRSWLSRVTF